MAAFIKRLVPVVQWWLMTVMCRVQCVGSFVMPFAHQIYVHRYRADTVCKIWNLCQGNPVGLPKSILRLLHFPSFCLRASLLFRFDQSVIEPVDFLEPYTTMYAMNREANASRCHDTKAKPCIALCATICRLITSDEWKKKWKTTLRILNVRFLEWLAHT